MAYLSNVLCTLRRTVCPGVLCVAALGGMLRVKRPPRRAVDALVFDNVTVIDVANGHRLSAQRVVIVGNRIRAVGRMQSVSIPEGAHVVDARGKYLIPGLWDMHTHPTHISRAEAKLFYRMFLANGVTGIRDASSPLPLDTLLRWRREIQSGTRIGPPRQLFSGPALSDRDHFNNLPCTLHPRRIHLCVKDSADARHVVDSLKSAGADIIKTYGLDHPLYFVIAAEARRVGIPFGGHVADETAIEASDSGATIEDHVGMAGGLHWVCLGTDATVEKCRPIAEAFQRNHTWWVPTMMTDAIGSVRSREPVEKTGVAGNGRLYYGAASVAILHHFFQFARTFWSDSSRDIVSYRMQLRDSASAGLTSGSPGKIPAVDTNGFLHIVHQVGLPIMAGTDCVDLFHDFPGFSLLAEISIYASTGLTPLEALQSATLNPARAFHATDSLGTVAPGKLADLVLLDADPLNDMTNITLIRAVVANGRYFDRDALDHILADVRGAGMNDPKNDIR